MLFIIYFRYEISISYLFHCILAPVEPIQILVWMYSLCLCLKQYAEKHRCYRAAELVKPKGEAVVTPLLLPQVPPVQDTRTDVLMNFFRCFMVMGSRAENTIFIPLKITEFYEQSVGDRTDQCRGLNSFWKAVLLKLDDISLLLKMKNVVNKHVV